MKITLINARGNDSQTAPFGLMYMAAVLEKEGHTIEIFDPLPDDMTFVDKISRSDMIGISFMTTEYVIAKEIANRVRKKAKYLLIGGVHVTALPKNSIKSLNADFGIVGEGEYTIRDLVNKLENGGSLENVKGLVWRDGKTVRINTGRELIENLDELPFPARHLLDYDWYLRPPGGIRGRYFKNVDKLLASRGCPYNCIYCGSCNVFGRKTRRRSVSNVISEIKFLIDKYDVEAVTFLDDTLMTNEEWLLEFCKEVTKLKIKWSCQARVNQITERSLNAMKDAGCIQLEFGIESGSNKVLKAMRKGTTSDMQKNAFDLVKKVGGMTTVATIMIGNPEETMEDIELTRKQILVLNADFTQIFFTTPFPGSDLYEIAMNNNWIKNKDFSINWDIRRAEKPVMEINFSADELVKIRSSLQNSLFLKNYTEYIKNPGLVSKMIYAFLLDRKNIAKTVKKFARTRKIDALAEDILKSYRLKYKKMN